MCTFEDQDKLQVSLDALTGVSQIVQGVIPVTATIWFSKYPALAGIDYPMNLEAFPKASSRCIRLVWPSLVIGHMSKYGHMSIRPPACLVWQVADKCPSLTDLQVVPALIDRLESPRSRNPPSSLSLLLLTAKLATIHLLEYYSGILFTFWNPLQLKPQSSFFSL